MPPEIENENRFQIIAENPRLSTAFLGGAIPASAALTGS
jgi:hypothetical protein